MKTFTMNTIIAVAALAVAAGNASAQTYKADIPMAFRAFDAVMAPGSYEFSLVSGASGRAILVIRNVNSHDAVTVAPFPGTDAPKAWRAAAHPLIGFACYGRACAIQQLWDGTSQSTLAIPVRKLPAAEAERASLVTLSLARTD
jgi:hypothetical protein